MFVGTIAPTGTGSEIVGSFRWHWLELAFLTIWLVFVGTAATAIGQELVTEVLAGRPATGTLAGFVVLVAMLVGFGLLLAAITRFRRLDEKEIGILLRDALGTSPTLLATSSPIGGSGRG